MKTKKIKKVFSSKISTNSGYRIKILAIFQEFSSEDQKKKRSSSRKFYEIRCESIKITKLRVANTDLGLDLHSSSPEPIHFFGAQSSLGGAQFSFGGARPRNAPRGGGPDANQPKFDVIDKLRKVSTGRKLREWLLERGLKLKSMRVSKVRLIA